MRNPLIAAAVACCLALQARAVTFESPVGPIAPEPIRLAELGTRLAPLMPLAAEPEKLGVLIERLQAGSVQIPVIEVPTDAAAAPTPAAPKFLASLEQTLAPYTADDLRKMPAGEIEGLSRRIMDGAQESGAASASLPGMPSFSPSAGLPRTGHAFPTAPAAAVPGPRRSVYLLSKPLEVEAHLGPLAQAAHYVFEASCHLIKSWLLLKAGLHPAAVGLEFAWSVAKAPAMISIQSMADLQIRYWWKKLKALKGLAQIPDVERIAVLTGTETHFKGVVAQRQHNQGLIFLETSKPLPPMTTVGFGEPLLIENPQANRLRLSLQLGGKTHPTTWSPSLQELLDRKVMPEDIAEAWRREIAAAKKDKPWRQRFFDFEQERSLKVHAVMVGPSGEETPLGVLSQGQSTKRLLGITRVDQAVLAFKTFIGVSPAPIQTLFQGPAPYAARSVPLSDTTVEPARFSLRGLPSRLWRRLLGRLIVVKP